VTLLIIVTAVLLLASGIVKLRAGERAGMGLSFLSLVEVLVGLLLVGVSISNPLTPSQGLGAVVASVVLVLFSSLRMWVRLRDLQRKRDLSEGSRLETYVAYLSKSLGPDGTPRQPEDQEP